MKSTYEAMKNRKVRFVRHKFMGWEYLPNKEKIKVFDKKNYGTRRRG